MLMKTVNYPMFYGAKPETFEKAKSLRSIMTVAEKELWKHISNRQLLNLKFRRQHPIYIFIADFYCHQIKLAIEIDSNIHLRNDRKEWDESRTAEMEHFGIKKIRFTNQQVMNTIEEVIVEIKKVCEELILSEG